MSQYTRFTIQLNVCFPETPATLRLVYFYANLALHKHHVGYLLASFIELCWIVVYVLLVKAYFAEQCLIKCITFHKVALICFSPQMFNSSNITTECPDAECLFAFYGGETLYHKYLILFQFYNLFLFFWCANFVTALGQVTLAGAFASYYWAFKKPDDIPAYPIFNSLGRALRCVTREIIASF